MKTLSVGEAAYIAGFIDGEGTISIWREKRPANRSGYRFKAAVHVFNTDKSVLEWIKSTVGSGWIVVKNVPKPKHKQVWALVFSASTVKELLPQLQPYLKVKHLQASLVIQFLSLMRAGSRQIVSDLEPLYILTQDLNRRGA